MKLLFVVSYPVVVLLYNTRHITLSCCGVNVFFSLWHAEYQVVLNRMYQYRPNTYVS